MNQAAVSVIIATFNRAESLRACLDSLARQTLRDFEIIVVDDGSTDATPAVFEEFRAAWPDAAARCYSNEENLGANVARNLGIRRSSGALVAMIDSDCIAEPGWLAALAGAFADPETATACGTTYTAAPGNIYELAYKGTNLLPARDDAARLVACNLMARRDVLLRFPLDEDLKYGCNEEGLFLRVRAAALRQRFVPGAIVHHRHPYERRSYFARARTLGAATAWLVYKFHLPPRLDLAPFLLGYAALLLALWRPHFLLAALLFFFAAAAALLYNERARKRKTWKEIVRCFPVVWIYYQLRVGAFTAALLRLHFFPNAVVRERLGETLSAAAVNISSTPLKFSR